MKVDIVSKEHIKPSSPPTPPHPKLHKVSLLDQFMPPVFTPTFFFYPCRNQGTCLPEINETISRRSQLLKQSLSETLTRFYTFGGKVKDSLCIDCNDVGANYVEARVNCDLLEFLKQPDLSALHKLAPSEVIKHDSAGPGSPVLMMQANTFACGGIVMCVCTSHIIADGIAFASFLRSWAAAARNASEEIVFPNFDASSIFPQNDAYPEEAGLMALSRHFSRQGRPALRRFGFDASAVASLKTSATSSSVKNPTRAESVSAFLCKCIVAVLNARSVVPRTSVIIQAVDMRRRAVPPMPVASMGNLIWSSAAVCTPDETKSVTSLVHRLREAVEKVDGEFVKNLQGQEGWLKAAEVGKAISSAFDRLALNGGVNHIRVANVCNIGFYDVDFGWGKPVWVSFSGLGAGVPGLPFLNMMYLMDTRMGKGVEAWVLLDEEEMQMLENDKELLAYASIEPSLLHMAMLSSHP